MEKFVTLNNGNGNLLKVELQRPGINTAVTQEQLDVTKHYTICTVTQKSSLLLMLGVRNLVKGRWVPSGGKIDLGETPVDGVIREVREETGLQLKKDSIWYAGALNVVLRDGSMPSLVHLFSCGDFEGKLKEGEEGHLKWYNLSKLPYDQMWEDHRYWIRDLAERRRRFDVAICMETPTKGLKDVKVVFRD